MTLEATYINARILIVDDNPANAALLEAILEEAGYRRLTLETDSREVLALHRRENFDLILLDIRMPHLDGHQVMEALTAHQTPEDYLPVLVLTAQTDGETRQRALENGARDFLIKPFDPTEVLLRIHNLLEVRQLYQERRRRAESLETAVENRTRELRERERRLAWLAGHDPVLELPNRSAFLERLGVRLQRPGVRGRVLLLAVQGYRRLESLRGHDFCDRVLHGLGRNLAALARELEGYVAYWGGGRFTLDLPAGPEPLESLQPRLERLLKGGQAVEGYEILLQSRGGLVDYPDHGREAEVLIRRASLAMSQARLNCVLSLVAYRPALEAQVVESYRLEQALAPALERGELELHYQPKLNLKDGRVCGAEALMRWHHPQWGMISPGRFIPLAEQTGLIDDMGLWAIRRALEDARHWDDSIGLAVNLSARQIDLTRARGGSLAREVLGILEATGTPPQRLELEITESAIMQDVDYALEELRRLRDVGVSLAVDDFGTGHSSLAYLRRLTVTTLKIDRAFVKDLVEGREAHTIVRSILAMGHALGLTVVGEGIETERDARALMDMGCDIGQGFLYSKPLPLQAFLAYLAAAERSRPAIRSLGATV